MKKVILFIAMSLDGYIADVNGDVSWLKGQDLEVENLDAYSEFIQEIDTVILGWNTYHQIATELFPDGWIYKGMTSYVVTHKKEQEKPEIVFTDENPCELVKRLKEESGKDIWICGGADIVRQIMEENLIDQYYISVIPAILGNGIRLFETSEQKIDLRLTKTQSYNGITDLVYERR